MKTVKFTISTLILFAVFGLTTAFGQWATVGTHIHNTNTGNVGIGTAAPGTLLHVAKNAVAPSIRIQNAGGSGGAGYDMVDNTSGADWRFKATNSGGFKIRDHANLLDVIVVEPNSAANALYISGVGYVGMGTNAPTANLHIVGGDGRFEESYPFLLLNSTTAGANAGFGFESAGSSTGWIFYDDSDDVLRFNASSSNGYRNDIVIKADGRVCIGTTAAAAGYALSVNGKAVCTEVLVEALANWPDYVFSEDYDLMTLSDLEQSIKENKHLPGIPSAVEVEENGILLGDMQTKLLQKVEELTLYIIEQDKQIEDLQQKYATLEKDNVKKTRRQK